jgi:hypothetical protein
MPRVAEATKSSGQLKVSDLRGSLLPRIDYRYAGIFEIVRVAMILPWTAAVAAINPSAIARGRRASLLPRRASDKHWYRRGTSEDDISAGVARPRVDGVNQVIRPRRSVQDVVDN